jgi:RNA polymerase sigma factor (sigma-70 family)
LNRKIKIAIVEDNPKIRETFRVIIESTSEFELTSSYDNAEEALKDIPKKNPDVILMDLNLPGKSGIEATRSLKKELNDLQVMVITVYNDSHRVFEALIAGADGYLLKRTPPEEIVEAIKDLHKGGSPMTPQIARMVVQSFRNEKRNFDELESLSEREREILSHLAKGYSYKEIGEELFISTETVRGHLRKIYKKLQVRSSSQAILKYLGK